METLTTKDGQQILALGEYGALWAMTFVKGGADEVFIDTGDSSTFNDLILSIRESGDLTADSIESLEKDFFEDGNAAIDIEDGATKTLLENGYKQESQYYFTTIA